MSKTLNNGEMLDASLETTLAVELFLNENYLFHRNVLNGKVEYVTKNPESDADQTPEDSLHWRPLTLEALNSIIRRAKRNMCVKRAVRRRKSWSLYTPKMCRHSIPSTTT